MRRALSATTIVIVLALASHGWAAEGTSELPSFGGLLLQALVSLLVVSALAFVTIRFGLSRWLKDGRGQSDELAVLATLPLGGRRTVYLVKAVDRLLVLGSSEAGLTPLADLGQGSAEGFEEGPPQSEEGPTSDEGDPE